MSTFEKDRKDALEKCDGMLYNVGEFSRLYTFTTENISGYIKHFDLPDKKLLTVGSSGDQVLNSYFAGARDITLFDINPFSRYYTFLKIAAIISLSYTQFRIFFFKHGLKFYYNRHMFHKTLFAKIKPTLKALDYESYLLFDEIFNKYEPEQIRSRLFEDDETRNKVIEGFNNYLHSEEEYNKMKKILTDIAFKFIQGDIYQDQIPGTYDNIFLSNLSNVKPFEEYKALLEKIDSQNLNSGGSMQIAYLWDIYFDETYYVQEWYDIYKLPLVKKQIAHFITEAQDIPGARDILWKENKNRDLVLIYRK